ncbi:MAG: hypothetical protein WD830_11145 [Chloroflexota bacterium]
MSSVFWRAAFRVQYRILALADPLIRGVWRRYGLGITIELRVENRDGSGIRSRLVGLLRAGTSEYVGHPNGDVGWTRDLTAAGVGTLVYPDGNEIHIAARRLDKGAEREAAIRATSQQPFPGNLIYRLARRHVRATGVYFRVEPA